MKTHKTVTLTRKFLRGTLHACEDGVDEVAALLPATLSTKPLDNLELAVQLIGLDRGWRANWLIENTRSTLAESYTSEWIGGDYNADGVFHRADAEDPGLVAQYLAIAADTILTARGA